MKNLSFTLAVALLGFSCAKAHRSTPPKGEQHRSAVHAGIEGNLVETTKQLLSGAYRSACDDKIEPIRQEIAAALDARADQIMVYKTKNPISENFRAATFGPTFAQERLTSPNPTAGWEEDMTPFSYYTDLYKKAMAGDSMKDWATLNDEFRGLLLDDVGRITKGYNYQLGREHVRPARQLFQELKVCKEKSECSRPELSEASRIFLETQERYKQEVADIKTAPTPEKARKEFEDFFEWVEADVTYWNFRPNPSVRKIGERSWTLPVDPGPFAPAAEQYKRYFHELWQVGAGKVQLELTQAPDIFRTLLGNDVGGRSFVTPKKKEITLMPGLRARTVAHELGHVLGFVDNYFSIFNPSDCSYKDQSKPDDLMSRSGTGAVLEEHWAYMAEFYK